jgi:hypothetical protein
MQRWGVNILTAKRRLDHPYSSAGKMAKWGGVGRGKLFFEKLADAYCRYGPIGLY